MPPLITSPRGRAVAIAIVGTALQAAIQLFLGAELEWDPLLVLAAGLLVATLAGAAAGVIPGVVVGGAGAALFATFVADDAVVGASTAPAWVAAGLAAGLVAGLLARASAERDAARAELGAVRDAAPAAFVTVGADDAIAGWSPAAERLFGRPAEEALGEPASVLGPELDDVLAAARAGDGVAEVDVGSSDESGNALRLAVRALAFGGLEGERVLLAAADATEAARLERELRDAEARHDALARNLPAVLYTHPPGERASLTYVSPHVKALLGYAADELAGGGVALADLVHPDERPRVEDELRAAASGRPFRSEYNLVGRDGRTVPVRDAATTVRDGNGRPLYVQGFILDLSDRLAFLEEREQLVQAKGEARADALVRQRRLDLSIEAGETLTSGVDAETALRRVANLAVRDFADWCAVDLANEDDELSRVTAAHAELIHDSETRAGAPDAVPAAEVRLAAARGEPVLAQGAGGDSRILAPMVARGHTLGVLTFFRRAPAHAYGPDDLAVAADIARRAALTVDAARLHHRVELEADAARVLAYVADGVFLVDRRGLIRLWNPGAEAITGFPATSMIDRRPSEAIPGWENFREQIPVADTAGPAAPQTVWLDTEDGQRWISISAVEFFGGTVYAFRDVTEVRRLEELKGDFVATASHELRTPLAAVYGAAQTLRRHDFALDEAGRERFVSMIVDEADRLSRIVNEILLATQLDAGGLEMAAEPFDPRDLVNRLAEATRSHLRPEITLGVVVRGQPPEVAADRDKVRQVLVNLIDNAVKYSPNGGNVEVGVEPDDGAVRFSVRDEGLGIPADEQERIFEKFYRLDPSMTRGVGGTGLGLYICHELVKRMGGQIWVESTHGKGSTFTFELPAVGTVAAPAPEPAEASGPGR